MLSRVGDKSFRSDGEYPSHQMRNVFQISDPETGVRVEFDQPVSTWRAMAVLKEAIASR